MFKKKSIADLSFFKQGEGLIERIDRWTTEQKRNFLCAVVGPTGSGKTYAALSLAHRLDPNFDVENIAFEPAEFINLVKDSKSGSVIIFDEAGVGYSSREFFSITNRALGYITQSFRFKRYVVFFTMPNLNFLDVTARKLLHFYIELSNTSVSRKEKVTRFKGMVIHSPPRKFSWLHGNDDIMFIYPRTKIDGKIKKITRFIISAPPLDLQKRYEAKRKQWANDYYEKLSKIARKLDIDKNTKIMDEKDKLKQVEKYIERIKSRSYAFVKEYKGKKIVDASMVRFLFNLNMAEANLVKRLAEQELNK